MRKLIAFLLILSASPAFATFGAATAWDVRTVGLDTNGGAFDSGVGSPGTNESLGSGTAITITLTGTTTGTGSPVFSATTHGPGNFVHIASGTGCTVGWYEILSQSAGTATFDHAMGSSTNICVGTIGGSLLVPLTAINLMAGSNTVWIQSGTYTQTAHGSITNALNPSPTYITGYASTHGDNGTAPLLTTSTNSVDIFRFSAGNFWVFTNISMSNTAATRGNGFQQTGGSPTYSLACTQCILDGFLNAINGDNSGAHGQWVNVLLDRVEIKNSTGDAIVNTAGSDLIITNSYMHGNSRGPNTNFNYQIVIGSLFTANTNENYKISGGTLFKAINSNFSGATALSADGLRFDTSISTLVDIENCIMYGNAGWGFHALTGTPVFVANNNNAYGANTLGDRSGISVGTGDVTLTATPFTASGSGDFSLNSTAGGGAALKGVGFPGIFPAGTTTGHIDIGAVQSAGGGGTAASNYGVSN
jgi:hypothetical protein